VGRQIPPPTVRRADRGTVRVTYRQTEQEKGSITMQLSARNQLNGTVQVVKSGTVMAEVTVNVDAGTVTAAITDSSRERLNLQAGDQVSVVIKATEVMIAKG
jgi:molybdopterin-binding protein